jgi:hypothetical protein
MTSMSIPNEFMKNKFRTTIITNRGLWSFWCTHISFTHHIPFAFIRFLLPFSTNYNDYIAPKILTKTLTSCCFSKITTCYWVILHVLDISFPTSSFNTNIHKLICQASLTSLRLKELPMAECEFPPINNTF